MAIVVYDRHVVTDAGVTYTVVAEDNLDALLLVPTTDPLTMLANIVVNFSGTPFEGQQIRVGWGKGFTLNGNTFTVNGISITDNQALKGDCYIEFTYINGGWGNMFVTDLRITNSLDGGILLDESVTLAKLEDLTSAQIIVGNGSNRPTAVAMTGDIAITNAGVTSIAAGVIVNADINASAAIDRSKLATGTASQVVVNDGSGVMTSVAEVPPVNGGTGKDTSASTGFATVSAGTWSVGAISEVITVPVSWESGEQCNNRVKIPFAGTVTNIYAVVTKALSGTDAGTIVPKNAASTNMTLASALSFAASSALETAIDTNVSANNTVAAGDIIYLTTAKTTVGGKALVSITITRES